MKGSLPKDPHPFILHIQENLELLSVSVVRRPAGKGPLRVSKPKAKGGGLGVKKMTTKVDDSLFDQAPAEAVIAPPPPVPVVRPSLLICYLSAESGYLLICFQMTNMQ